MWFVFLTPLQGISNRNYNTLYRRITRLSTLLAQRGSESDTKDICYLSMEFLSLA